MLLRAASLAERPFGCLRPCRARALLTVALVWQEVLRSIPPKVPTPVSNRSIMLCFDYEENTISVEHGSATPSKAASMNERYRDCYSISTKFSRELNDRIRVGERRLAELLERADPGQRDEIFRVAEELARGAVADFAAGLIDLQSGKLANHEVDLREYTGYIVGQIRDLLASPPIVPSGCLPPWRQDPIAQGAIHTCEKTIAERQGLEEPGDYASASVQPNFTWVPMVQEWEAHRARTKAESDYRRVTEAEMRQIICAAWGGNPDDLTMEQIGRAAVELCAHFGTIQMIPSTKLDNAAEKREEKEAVVVGSVEFWEKKEAEFRNLATPGNSGLRADHYSPGGWMVFNPHGPKEPARESERMFQSLARDAAHGISGSKNKDPSWNWLDSLADARDQITGQLLYTKHMHSTSSISEEELARMERRGEQAPPNGIVEFVMLENGADTSHCQSSTIKGELGTVRRRWFFEDSSAGLSHLFNISAEYCVELRSLARHRVDAAVKETKEMQSDPQGEGLKVPPSQSLTPGDSTAIRTDRASAVLEYKAKGHLEGIRVTDKMIAKEAGGWSDRTIVSRWKSYDRTIKSGHDASIRRLLAKDPLSIWEPKKKGKPARTTRD